MMSRSRSFCFTHNNFKEGDREKLSELRGTVYGIIGCEGKDKTPHLQGYLYYKEAKTLSSVIKNIKKLLKKAPHVEIAKGSALANKAYCSKEGDYIEWGELPKQGKRSDLEHCAEMLRDGDKMSAVAEAHPSTFVRYHKGLAALQGIFIKEKTKEFRKVEVIFITGPTGCGKTRMAMEEAKYKITGAGLQWWDGYEGEDCIVIDEYNNNVKIDELLNLLDGYQLRLPIKGGFTYANWTKVFITSNLRVLHEQAKDAHKAALARRITKTIDMWVSGKKRSLVESISSDFVF